jgi:hypothetical protein
MDSLTYNKEIFRTPVEIHFGNFSVFHFKYNEMLVADFFFYYCFSCNISLMILLRVYAKMDFGLVDPAWCYIGNFLIGFSDLSTFLRFSQESNYTLSPSMEIFDKHFIYFAVYLYLFYPQIAQVQYINFLHTF